MYSRNRPHAVANAVSPTAFVAALAVSVVLAFAGRQAVAQVAVPSGSGTLMGKLDPSAPLFDKLPADVVEATEIVAGIIIAEPPSTFIDPKTKQLNGSDIDLLKALSGALGIPFRLVPTSYGAFVPGLRARRFDMVAAFIADTQARQAVVDFVDDYATRDVAVVKKTSPLRISSLADLCGHTVAIDQGHYLVPQIMAEKQACENRGKTMRVDIFLGGPASLQAVRTGRSEVVIASGATALYAVKMTDGDLKIASEAIGKPVLVGYAFRKGNDTLRDAIAAAFASIMNSGEYRGILETWGLAEGALQQPYINEGPNAAKILGTKQAD